MNDYVGKRVKVIHGGRYYVDAATGGKCRDWKTGIAKERHVTGLVLKQSRSGRLRILRDNHAECSHKEINSRVADVVEVLA